MSLIKCSECGADVSEKAVICPKCGCPVEVSLEEVRQKKKSNVKKIIIGTVALIIVALIAFGIYKFVNRADTSGYYNGFKWGMTYEQVKEQLGDEALGTDDKKYVYINIEDYDGKEDIDALITYECIDNLLCEITIFISNGDGSSYTDESLIEDYIEELDKLYGQYEKDSIFYVWNTEKSKIELTYFSDRLVVLNYKDINIVDSVHNEEKQ